MKVEATFAWLWVTITHKINNITLSHIMCYCNMPNSTFNIYQNGHFSITKRINKLTNYKTHYILLDKFFVLISGFWLIVQINFLIFISNIDCKWMHKPKVSINE